MTIAKCQNCGAPAELVWSYLRANGEPHTMKICGACMGIVWANHSGSHVGQTSTFEDLAA